MRICLPNIHNQLLLSTPLIPYSHLSIGHNHRTWKRRRIKYSKFCCNFSSSSFEYFYNNLISQIPSLNPNSLLSLAPVLGIASAFAVYLSKPKELISTDSSIKSLGDWILFTSPTPFNRFVILRCPSICFDGVELLEGVNERLVKEERHIVRLNRGTIQLRESGDAKSSDEKQLVYQRVCVGTEDGGVISIDWPANLDLEDERGLDTTVVIIPGTAEGSGEKCLREFVCECLRQGCFPLVMNPRGSAGSPLTTARLFSVADSDDVSAAIEYIKKARPWSTMVAVGWGYGANMLTKYLGEVGERTPLIAATCINNPFDLEEATRHSPHHIVYDKKFTDRFIEILQSNKELFQRRTKRFDVVKALSSTSIRDFEKAISMVSYGFDNLEEFYAKSSTIHAVIKVKIPTLFIQKDDGSVPVFSVPRHLIAENPFTSLLVCSSFPSSKLLTARLTSSWCQHLTIEWLTAVELALLKGRHPLVMDVDVTINPSMGLGLLDKHISGIKSSRGKKQKILTSNASDEHTLDLTQTTFEESDTLGNINPRSSPERISQIQNNEENKDGVVHKANAIDTLVAEAEISSEVEKGQVLQTAQVVINMLDVTMPNILTDEQKQKVLTAVDQGESLMKALQDVVPEDVREKLTSSVSGIFQNKTSNVELDDLFHLQDMTMVASGLRSNVQDKVKAPHTEGEKDESNSNKIRGSDDPLVVSQLPLVNHNPGHQVSKDLEKSTNTEKDIGGVEDADRGINDKEIYIEHSDKVDSELETESNKTESSSQSKRAGGTHDSSEKDKIVLNDERSEQDMRDSNGDPQHEKNIADSFTDKAHIEEKPILPASSSDGTDRGINDKEMYVEHSDDLDSELETGSNKTGSSSQSEGASGTHDSSEKDKLVLDDEKSEQDSDPQHEKNIADSSTDESHIEEKPILPASSSEMQSMNDESRENHKKDVDYIQPSHNQQSSSSPSLNVSQTLDALTGADDSTQLAVNSVFNVLEDMITQLADENKNKTEAKDDKNVEDQDTISSSVEHLQHTSNKMEGTSEHHDVADDPSHNKLVPGEESTGQPVIVDKCIIDTFQEVVTENYLGNEDRKGKPPVYQNPTEKSATYLNKTSNGFSLPVSAYGNPLHQRYLHRIIISKKDDSEPLDLESTTALFLAYFPEEGQWKPLDKLANENPKDNCNDIIEPSNVILDAKERGPDEQLEVDELHENASKVHKSKVKTIIMDALEIEVRRRLSATSMQEMNTELSGDIEHVANAVCLALKHEELLPNRNVSDNFSEDIAILQGEHVTRAVSSALLETATLRQTLPIGVVLGSCLAALKKYANVEVVDCSAEIEGQAKSGKFNMADSVTQEGVSQKGDLDQMNKQYGNKVDANNSTRNAVVVGAMSAALGASAFLANQQPLNEKENAHTTSTSPNGIMSEKTNDSLVTSFAEKAMSVAGPVVPTKEDGEVDQEKLVAMLAALGQRGGILRLVGKFALLWGGIRGAMSLTDKLISVLRIAERPLYQRISGFICLVLVLWSPVVVPLLPSLVQGWTTHSSSKIVELGCIIGLYASILILITSWGRRIRGYEKPLEQYGLDLNSTGMVQEFLKGLIGGIMLVLLIQSLNVTLGCVNLHWPTALPLSSSGASKWIKVYGKMLVLMIKGLATATGISLVEELLFRSWLPDEIAADLGYHQGIIISGLLFALFQRSPLAIPGLWLLSLALTGVRQRSKGQLWRPIGLRAGMLASSFIVQGGGYTTYQPNFPLWMTGTNPLQPFNGVIGLAAALVLALFLYPSQQHQGKRLNRTIRD